MNFLTLQLPALSTLVLAESITWGGYGYCFATVGPTRHRSIND